MPYESSYTGNQIDDSIKKINDIEMVTTQINSSLKFSNDIKNNISLAKDGELLVKNSNGLIEGSNIIKSNLLIKGDPVNDLIYLVGTGGVNNGSVVFLTPSTNIMLANSNNVTHADRIVGITLNEAKENENCTVRINGTITNNNWNLNSGSIYYLGYGGELTQIKPVIGFIQKIGLAINTNTLLLQIGNPILL